MLRSNSGALKHFFNGSVTKVNINTPAGLDAFVDDLDAGSCNSEGLDAGLRCRVDLRPSPFGHSLFRGEYLHPLLVSAGRQGFKLSSHRSTGPCWITTGERDRGRDTQGQRSLARGFYDGDGHSLSYSGRLYRLTLFDSWLLSPSGYKFPVQA